MSRDVRPPVQMRHGTWVSSRMSTQDSDIPSSCDMKHEPKFKPCREIQPSLESGLSRYIPLETERTESLSPTYCCGKTPLELLVENWLTSSVKERESALILRLYVLHGTFFRCCAVMNIHIDLMRVSQRISVVSSRKSCHLYCILWNTR